MEPKLRVIEDAGWLTHLARHGITKESVRYWSAAYDIEALAEESFQDYVARLMDEFDDLLPYPLPKVRITSTMRKWASRWNPSQLAAPRGFYDGDGTIHVKKSAMDNHKLLAHEYGHAIGYEDEDHPVSLLGGLIHAIRVRFDVRAFTGLLRFRNGPADLIDRYKKWRLMLAAT